MKPIGSGPFKLVEFKPGEYVILEAYDKFFLGAPHIKKLIAKVITDPVSRLVAVEQKECQMIVVDSMTEIRRMEKLAFLQVEPTSLGAGALNWLAFNTKHKPLDDKLVRQAISYAIDRDFIVNRLQLGVTKRATGPIHPSSPFYTSKVNHYDLNLAKAAALLDQAGYPEKNGVRFTLTIDYIPGSPEQQKNIVEYLKPQLKKVGIDVIIRTSPDFPTWANRVSNWDFEATMDAVYNWGDPVIGVHRTYLSDNIHKGVIWSNTQQYSNPKVDEILDKAGKETNLAKRKALYAEFQQIVVDDAPIAFINTLPYYIAYDKKLKNVNKTIWGIMSPMHEIYWGK
jgi:peptide/nickel transport system substrate-binding protein